MTVRILEGDCRDVLRTLPDCSVDSVVTDPPYELTTARPGGRSEATRGKVMGGFMGMAWDGSGVAFDVAAWVECLRVLKPGGHLLSFGGSRTYHRMACAIEDAGFEIRDQIMWLYGSGFPKSLDVSKAIDKDAGHWRGRAGAISSGNGAMSGGNYERTPKGDPITAAAAWQGWGTALKPAHEPIVVARKPLIGTVAENVQTHGCGALNIDGCRVEGTGNRTFDRTAGNRSRDEYRTGTVERGSGRGTDIGRWPANVMHDGSEEVLACFPAQAGQQSAVRGTEPSECHSNIYCGPRERQAFQGHGDSGSAARFFYCAKASAADRNVGGADNTHPTVKPTELMRYLVRLVTPPGGTVLDPFAGSGSTGRACDIEGFDAILIELLASHVAIAKQRIAGDAPLFAEVDA